MYLDITADVLLGTPLIPGVLPDMISALGVPSWLSGPLLNRPVFLFLFSSLITAPVSLRRNMADLDGLNMAGLVALGTLGMSLAWLSALAVAKVRMRWGYLNGGRISFVSAVKLLHLSLSGHMVLNAVLA